MCGQDGDDTAVPALQAEIEVARLIRFEEEWTTGAIPQHQSQTSAISTTTLSRRQKAHRPGGSRGQTAGYVDRWPKEEREGVAVPAGRGAQG